ncbi:RNA-binding protein 44 [Toxotes jaculatrix]|uniref:RNA-binding protein 44 n=1 Tax=Toxotes jaculatrix TaxID=941984 RepID=UPI001B3A95D5|nr:RNA-binding protein 44 [Toxotes jaculatrix]
MFDSLTHFVQDLRLWLTFIHFTVVSPSTEESRKLFLYRSLFSLVDAHTYLALTDQRLLGWYLCLSPEDRKIIQDEGGFHQFLQRHPALELSRHHVYVKYNIGSSSPVQQTVTSNKQKSTSAKTCRWETNHTHLELEMHRGNMTDYITQAGCGNSGDGSQKQPHEEIYHTSQLIHLPDSFHTAYNSSITQEASHQMAHRERLNEEEPSRQIASTSGVSVYEDAAASESFSLGMELERCRQRGNPELRSQMSDVSASSTCAEVSPLESEWAAAEKESSSEVYSFDSIEIDGREDNDGSIVQSVELEQVNRAPTCDATVGTEQALCVSASTQTEDPETADKNVITEVHMSDLDYLAKEFTKLRTAQEELRERKEKSSVGKLRKECDCIQRAQQAELCLLALQYSMCRQHCWRVYCTSAEGEQLTAARGDMKQCWPKDPSENILSVLQKLESDYNQMRDKILDGFPLEQLKPLSVDSGKITTGVTYIPAQVKKVNSKPSRAVSHVLQDRGANHDARKPEEKQTSAACKELSVSEAWYDAEEDLEAAAATGLDQTAISEDRTNESASDEAKSSVLCVSNLPSNVTQSDVMLWFEKYHPSEVSVSVLKNDVRVAIVMVSGPQSAEAAVREMNGFSREGHTLNVEHISGAVGGSQTRSQSQASASVSEPESSQEVTKPQPPKTDLSGAERKLISQPPLSSGIKNRKVICISPTAKGTCVPQHYGTMGSFDTLMAELTQRHPEVGRQRIVDALIELRAKHRGILSGLPLRTIREMTSELLAKPASATQI